MPVPAKLADFLSDLALLQDRQERIAYLIDLSERFHEPPADVAARPFSEDNRVPHCESEAFVWALPQTDGTLRLEFAVENPQGVSAKSLAVIMQQTLAGAPAEQVADIPEDIVYEIFGRELSMGKSMGLMSMVRMVKSAAKESASNGARGLAG